MTSIEAPEAPTPRPTMLTAQDRCDRCGAQAYVLTTHDTGPLLWCRSHFNRYRDALGPLVIVDERYRLEELVAP